MSRIEIWVDHLEDLARVVREYDRFRKSANTEMPGNHSDLEFFPGPVEVRIDGENTGWSIDYCDNITWLVIEKDDDDPSEG